MFGPFETRDGALDWITLHTKLSPDDYELRVVNLLGHYWDKADK